MSLALGINLQQPGSAQDAGTAPPPPAPKKEPEPEPEPEVERTPEEQKAFDQKQLALAHKAKGNECYKAKKFDEALKHYDDAIAAYNELAQEHGQYPAYVKMNAKQLRALCRGRGERVGGNKEELVKRLWKD